MVEKKRYTHVPAKTGLKLNAGYNTVNVKGVSLYAPIVVPVSNGVNLPEDISREYRYGRQD